MTRLRPREPVGVVTVTSPGSRWLDVDTVAGITGYARKTLYQMAREGRIPAVRVGRSVRWDRRELDRWMESRPRANT